VSSSVLTETLHRWLSGESRTHKAFLNSLASGLDTGTRLVVGFVISPLLVAGLGPYAFGLWQVLRQLVGYATPASGRPTQALKWMIAKEQESQDYQLKRQYVGSTVALWLAFLPVLGLAGGVLAWFAPEWLDTPAEMSSAARWTGALLAGNLILMTLVEIPRAVLAGENLAYKRMGLSALLVAVGGGLTALALYLDLGLVGVAACPVLSSLLSGALFLGVVRRHVTWFGVARPARRMVRTFVQLSGWFLVWRIVAQAMRASDLVVLGAFDSVTTVTTYTLTRYVAEALFMLIVVVISGALPGLGGVLGSGDVERARSLRSEMLALSWLVTTVVGSAILLWNRSFVGLWVGPEHFAGAVPTLLIVLMTAQFIMIRIDANVIDLTLDLKAKVLMGLLSTLLSVGAAAVLVAHFGAGIEGLCVGFMAGRTLLSLIYPWLVGQVLEVSLGAQLRGALRPTLVGGLLCAAAFALEPRCDTSSWPELALGVGASTPLITALALFGGLSGTQRRQLWARLAA
jgi:O-antigen/teichoic acid export membrane protein